MALSTVEVAQRLNISERRVRALLKDGRIRGQQVAGRWIIENADAASYKPGGIAGRPLSKRSAWQFIQYLPYAVRGDRPPDLSPVDWQRLRQRWQRLLESEDPAVLVRSLLAKRSDKVEMSSNPADLVELRRDNRIRLSGVSHPASGLLSNSEVEAYVSRDNFDSVVRDWLLVKAPMGSRPNVVLHVAEELPEEVPPLLVAADLAERPGTREQAAARELIGSVNAH
ncbi:helix-turn-helix domain-containing protein [Arthrobacter sp. ISL-30]|uniref:helix-turn-helix domain-containing protein n=1 Tax=Arthrobacter sp. ISL-30 TaxID=2819109 RepID=UPI001BEBB88A|nr:helix-turn-helix domain-containing protein [Arthrobacter sp. ISL-30]MBT2513398.1 helix-turn-helix domain-containing protein [Arthrobacter sp. ISL-30]